MSASANKLTVFTSQNSDVGVRNFPSAAVSAATFGERPRQAADAAHLLLLAGSQRRCSVDGAGALKVCLRSVEIFDWKDRQNKKSAARATGHDHVAGDIP